MKNKRGITLIALIITIIVLLILAGVSISIVVGDNGIIKQVQNAKIKYSEAEDIELLELAVSSARMEDENCKKVTKENLEKDIRKSFKEEFELIDLCNNMFLVKFNNNREYVIEQNGEVKNNKLIDDSLPENEYLRAFITEWTVNAGDTIVLPIYEKQEQNSDRGEKETYFDYDFTVDYGDGTIAQVTSYDDIDKSHTYIDSGVYEVKITGKCEGWSFEHVSSSIEKITKLKQWGVVSAKHIDFDSCINLRGEIPVPALNSFKDIESFFCLFYKCSNIIGIVPNNLFKNATNVVNMGNVFNFTGINKNIPGNLFWNCPNIETFRYVFAGSNVSGEVPKDLFKYNLKVWDFRGAFKECQNLYGEIDERFFSYSEDIVELYSPVIFTNLKLKKLYIIAKDVISCAYLQDNVDDEQILEIHVPASSTTAQTFSSYYDSYSNVIIIEDM